MSRIAIVNAKNGLVLGTDDANILTHGEDEVLAWAANHVANCDPEDARVFHIYRLRQWEGMSEADYYGAPDNVSALLAAGATHVREVRVPMDRDYTRPYGP